MEACFEFGKSLPFAVEPGVARVIDSTKVVDVAPLILGRLQRDPGEEGGGVEVVAVRGGKGGPVGRDTVTGQDEEGGNGIVVVIGEVEGAVVAEACEHARNKFELVAVHPLGLAPERAEG